LRARRIEFLAMVSE